MLPIWEYVQNTDQELKYKWDQQQQGMLLEPNTLPDQNILH